MRRSELVEALSATVPETQQPIPGVQTPPGKIRFTSLRHLVSKAEESVQSRVEDLQDWVHFQNPESINRKNRVVTEEKRWGKHSRKYFPKNVSQL